MQHRNDIWLIKKPLFICSIIHIPLFFRTFTLSQIFKISIYPIHKQLRLSLISFLNYLFSTLSSNISRCLCTCIYMAKVVLPYTLVSGDQLYRTLLLHWRIIASTGESTKYWFIISSIPYEKEFNTIQLCYYIPSRYTINNYQSVIN